MSFHFGWTQFGNQQRVDGELVISPDQATLDGTLRTTACNCESVVVLQRSL